MEQTDITKKENLALRSQSAIAALLLCQRVLPCALRALGLARLVVDRLVLRAQTYLCPTHCLESTWSRALVLET